MSDLDYLGHLARESARFAAVLDAVPAGTAVPTCPEWDADELLWHLCRVQWFWEMVVTSGLLGTDQVMEREAARPERPATRAELASHFVDCSRALLDVLTATAPATPAWTWANDKTVGFIRRRQAHEALIHRIDAELTAGERTGMDPALSADGVDEALRVMYGGDAPAWGQFEPQGERTLRIRPTDTPQSWLVTLGQFSGTDPDDGKHYDQASIRVANTDPSVPATATISGSAADLDCWLWNRPTEGELDRAGDPGVLADFDALIAAGIN